MTLYISFNYLFKVVSLYQAGLPPHGLAVFKKYQCGHPFDVIGAGRRRVLVHVHFQDRSAVAKSLLYLVEDGAIILLGPHHSAEKSINTGLPEFIIYEKVAMLL